MIDPIANPDEFDDPQPNREFLMNETSPHYNEDYPSWITADITSSFTGKKSHFNVKSAALLDPFTKISIL